MKVLYVIWDYPYLSESYINAEIEYFLSEGIEIRVWAENRSPVQSAEQVPVYREGSLPEALRDFDPDIVHVQWIHAACRTLGDQSAPGRPPEPRCYRGLVETRCPITVRGHSFDFSLMGIEFLIRHPKIRKIYLFPHFASAFNSGKIVGLDNWYNPRFYYPSAKKDRRMALRAGPGHNYKGHKDFMLIASLSPGFRFVHCLIKSRLDWMEELILFNRSLGNPVEIHKDLQYPEMSRIQREAWIYIYTFTGKAHPYGCPSSMLEALATGSYVMSKDDPNAGKYVGSKGALYGDPSHAARLVCETLSWSDGRLAEVQEASIAHAQNFRPDRLLPRILEDWRSF